MFVVKHFKEMYHLSLAFLANLTCAQIAQIKTRFKLSHKPMFKYNNLLLKLIKTTSTHCQRSICLTEWLAVNRIKMDSTAMDAIKHSKEMLYLSLAFLANSTYV